MGDQERPEILDDIVLHLTGITLSQTKQAIREDEEYAVKTVSKPNHNTDDNLKEKKNELPKVQYTAITEAFNNLCNFDN